MERSVFPSPYKLVTWKHSNPSWHSSCSQHIFDCISDPMSQDFEGSLKNIADYHYLLTEYIVKTINQVNASPDLKGTGCKYYLTKVNAIDGSGRDTEGKARAWIVLKLANMSDIFRAAGGNVY